MVRTAVAAALGALLGLIVHAAQGQQYPAKPVKIVSPTGPGLSTDVVARMLAEKLSRSTGHQFFVENLPGAATIVGAQAGAKAVPDGYTLLMATAGTIVNRETVAAASQPDFAERLGSFGMYTHKLGSRQATMEALKLEKERWTRIVRELGIEPQ